MTSLRLGSMAFSVGADSDLPRLTEHTEIQKMLADEKMRSEQHKTNYQTIKVEHTKLQDEFVKLQMELKATIEESKLVQEKYKLLLEQTRKELAGKHVQCEEMKSQVLSEQRMEIIKLQIQDDIEKPLRAKVAALTDEGEQYRSEFNKLKYEYSFLKSEYEHERAEQARVLEEVKMRHEAEVNNLRREREAIVARQQGENSGDGQKVRLLQRENAQLNLKVKGLLSELEEIRAQREHQGLQSDHVTRMQSKQLAEHSGSIKALETEKESLKMQNESLQKELTSSTDLANRLTMRTHDLEKTHIILKNRVEEVTHKTKVDLTNMKMAMLKERGELERHRDRLLNEMEDFKAQLEIKQHEVDQLSASLVEKERDIVKRVQAAREEEWQKTHAIENEKIDLETRIQQLERQKIDDESHQQAAREKMEDRIQAAMETREAAEKDALVMRTKVQHMESVTEQLERERSQNSEFKMKLHRLETEYNSYVSNENELLDVNARLKQEVDRYTEEVRRCRDDVSRGKEATERGLAEQRASWVEEKFNLQRRVDELEDQLSQTQVKLATAGTDQKKKKKKYLRVATRLKDRVALLQAKMEELQIERDHLKKYVQPETHLKLKKNLNDLIRRHREFRAVLTAADLSHVAIGDLSFVSAHNPNVTADCSGTQNWTFLETGSKYMSELNIFQKSKPLSCLFDNHQKDLDLLKERLDLLDDNQRAQLDEFRNFQKSSTPIKERVAPLDLETSSEEEKDSVPEKDIVST